MPKWHKRSFDSLQPEDVVEFFEHGQDPNEDPTLTPHWDGPVEVKTSPAKPGRYDGGPGGKIVTVGSESYRVRSDRYQAWVREGRYAWDEIQLRRK